MFTRARGHHQTTLTHTHTHTCACTNTRWRRVRRTHLIKEPLEGFQNRRCHLFVRCEQIGRLGRHLHQRLLAWLCQRLHGGVQLCHHHTSFAFLSSSGQRVLATTLARNQCTGSPREGGIEPGVLRLPHARQVHTKSTPTLRTWVFERERDFF